MEHRTLVRILTRDAMADMFDADISDTDILLGEVAHKVEREVTALNAVTVRKAVARILGV